MKVLTIGCIMKKQAQDFDCLELLELLNRRVYKHEV